jgi:acyl-CoA dehydrogenase
MIIFGQGAIRGHPFVLDEIAATRETDRAKASEDFDRALWGHVRFVLGNAARALWLGLTGARFVRVPGAPELKRTYQQLTRLSAGFAFAADLTMLFLGGSLKRREKLSGRLGDILSQMYLVSAVLKRYEDDGRQRADLPLVQWAAQDALLRIEDAFYGVFANFPNRLAGWKMRFMIFPWGRVFRAPVDQLGHRIAQIMMEPSQVRDRLTNNTFIWKSEDDPIGNLELAMEAAPAGEAVEAKLRAAARAGVVEGFTDDVRLAGAVDKGILSKEEAGVLRRFWKLRHACIMVDDFPQDIGRNVAPAREPATVTALDGTYSR